MQKILIVGAFVFIAAAPAQAESWKHMMSRGLEVYEAHKGRGAMQLVCDPDRVFGKSPNTSLIIKMPKDRDPKRIVFLSEDGSQAHFVP